MVTVSPLADPSLSNMRRPLPHYTMAAALPLILSLILLLPAITTAHRWTLGKEPLDQPFPPHQVAWAHGGMRTLHPHRVLVRVEVNSDGALQAQAQGAKSPEAKSPGARPPGSSLRTLPPTQQPRHPRAKHHRSPPSSPPSSPPAPPPAASTFQSEPSGSIPSPDTSPSSPPASGAMSMGAIVGVAVGSAVALALLLAGLLGFFFFLRRKKASPTKELPTKKVVPSASLGSSSSGHFGGSGLSTLGSKSNKTDDIIVDPSSASTSPSQSRRKGTAAVTSDEAAVTSAAPTAATSAAAAAATAAAAAPATAAAAAEAASAVADPTSSSQAARQQEFNRSLNLNPVVAQEDQDPDRWDNLKMQIKEFDCTPGAEGMAKDLFMNRECFSIPSGKRVLNVSESGTFEFSPLEHPAEEEVEVRTDRCESIKE